jgi:cephalosporin hydroxylase
MVFKAMLAGLRPGRKSVPADPVVNSECREIEVDNWVLSSFVCDRLVRVVGVHPFPLNELKLMAAAICRLKPTHIFDWGTHFGKSARVFHETARAFAIETEIHSIDLPDNVGHHEHPGQNRGCMVMGLPNMYLHLGDGLETALRICAQFPMASTLPLFFVDGDHAYDSVRRELLGIIKHVPQASILVHDTFNQSAESGYNVGPYAAIRDVLQQCPDVFKVYAQNLSLPGMTLLWRQRSP